jgi:hypothetical protein
MTMNDSTPIRWERDPTPAAWVADRLRSPQENVVGSLVPAGYQAYARLFHPAFDSRTGSTIRWEEIARRNRRIPHPRMQFSAINRLPEDFADDDVVPGPSLGSLPVPQRETLIDLLEPETATAARCWFCTEDGLLVDDQGIKERVRLPSRATYLLHEGHIDRALVPPPHKPARKYEHLIGPLAEQSPNLWWPDDRAWFVATVCGLASTYIGGSRGLIDRLLGSSDLEVLETGLMDSVSESVDPVNG